MTLYYTLVFAILMAEMAMFMLLIIPFPYAARRKIFTFMAESPLVAKLQYGMKITFIFILILFIDSVNRVYRVQVELSAHSDSQGHNVAGIMGHERTEVQARKFYSQRNMYLCGFTLFLSLILNRTYTLILEVLVLEGRVKDFKNASTPEDVKKLRDEVEKKNIDILAMKSQAMGLHREFDALTDKYQEAIWDRENNSKKDD